MIPNFDEMNVKDLKAYAKDNNIDLGEAKLKADIITTLQNYYNINEEDPTMNDNKIANEMENNPEVNNDTSDANNVAPEETKVEEKKVWHNAEGEEVSMSEFIREKFTKDNLSRKEIAEQFEINYRTVYGATVNMTNEAEPASRGRGAINPKIRVTEDNKVFTEKTEGEGDAAVTKYFLDGEEIVAGEDGSVEVPVTVETDRNTWIKDQVSAGVSRGDIAKILDLSYGVVYGLTKEEEGTRQKYEIEIDDPEKPGEKKTISRSEYIRMRVAAGVSKSDVAKELGVEYSVVWQSCKKDKTDADRLTDTVASLEKFADKVNDKEAFIAAVEVLKAFSIVEPKEEDTKEEDTAGEAKEKDTEVNPENSTEA